MRIGAYCHFLVSEHHILPILRTVDPIASCWGGVKPLADHNSFWVGFGPSLWAKLDQTWRVVGHETISWVQTQSLRHVEQLLSHVWAIPTFQAVFLFVTLPNHTTVVNVAARYWLYKRDLAKAREHFYQVSMMLTFCRSADRSGWGVQWDCEKWWKMDIWWE